MDILTSNYSGLGRIKMSSEQETLLTPSEVANLFRVDPKTVTRWAKAGKLTSIRTLGGHRRYKESEVKALLITTTGKSIKDGGK
jgi:excisionase family DNA binding protein